jgi:formiminoglutamase
MALDLRHTFEWTPARDPNDETFGGTVDRVDLAALGERAPAAVLLGEPYDGGVLGRTGARKGPRALRTRFAATKTHHLDAGPVGDVCDLGDVAVRGRRDGDYPDSTATVQDRVAELTRHLHDAPTLPVFLGGDNSLTVANVRPLLERSGTVGVVSLDAHLDCREPVGDPSSGTPYRQLLESGLDDLAVVGARHFETSTAYHDYCRDRGGTVVTAEECAEPVAAVDRALPAVDHLYLSVDLDVLSAAAGPGVSAPTPGGLSSRELFRIVRLVASAGLAGLEVVECSPPHDEADRTARTGARAVAHALAADAAR